MTHTLTKEERLNNALQAALSTIHNLPPQYFEGNYVPKPAIDNYLQMVRQEFVEETNSHNKLNSMVDGMLLMREFQLKKINGQ